MSYFLLAQPKGINWGESPGLLILGGILLIVGLIFLFVFFSFVQLWIQCLLTGAKIGIVDMVRMKLCKVDYAHDRATKDRPGAGRRQSVHPGNGSALPVQGQRANGWPGR